MIYQVKISREGTKRPKRKPDMLLDARYYNKRIIELFSLKIGQFYSVRSIMVFLDSIFQMWYIKEILKYNSKIFKN